MQKNFRPTMRNAFADELVNIASTDERVVLLSGDIGNRLFDPFKKHFPKRFYNCGVAEANMASMASGMASSHLRPITYTITPFNTTRCLEQIRVDICYQNVPVIIIGVGAGLSYASLGCTHHSLEDISFLKSLPNMIVTCPADSFELRKIMREALKLQSPVYIRIGKKGEPLVHQSIPDLTIGKAHVLQKGKDICLLSTGNVMPLVLQAAKELESQGMQPQVVSMHTVKPLDIAFLENIFQTFSLIACIEEHSLIGGLSSSICEWMVDHSITKPHFLRFGTEDLFPKKIGSQAYLRNYFGLTTQNIVKKIIKRLSL